MGRLCYLLFLFFLLSPCLAGRLAPNISRESKLTPVQHFEKSNYTWGGFQKFLNAEKGSTVNGISKLKDYFRRFGYLPLDFKNFTDVFDDHLEDALLQYQSKLGLPRSGKLDSNTVSQIMLPRCGAMDIASSLHLSENFSSLPEQQRWTKSTLTYALSPDDSYNQLNEDDIKQVIQRAFTRWASVIPLEFTESQEYEMADIKIGFYKRDHGDGVPFNGAFGVLAHGYFPQDGRIHIDADETWAIDLGLEKSKAAFDLESVMIHEIGHALGIHHSSVKEAVMYPSIHGRTKKVNLQWDDVKGAQDLYGSNPDFTLALLLPNTSVGKSKCSSILVLLYLASLFLQIAT